MKTLKKLAALVAVLALALAALTGCSSSSDEDTTIVVGACPSPHAEVLEIISDILAEEGYTLEIVEFEDYVTPNSSLTDGDLDANYFQHQPYLDQYNEENGTDIVSAGTVHYEAMGIYAGTKSSLSDIEYGDKVAVPNDVTNEARALQLLESAGLITLKDGAGLTATVADIEDNPYGLEIVELEAALIPSALPDVAIAVINANYAIEADIIDTALVFEDAESDAAQTYANIVACRSGDEDSDKIQALVAAIQSDAVVEYLEETYGGVIQTIF